MAMCAPGHTRAVHLSHWILLCMYASLGICATVLSTATPTLQATTDGFDAIDMDSTALEEFSAVSSFAVVTSPQTTRRFFGPGLPSQYLFTVHSNVLWTMAWRCRELTNFVLEFFLSDSADFTAGRSS
jgi:hypothetical protein